MNHLLATASSQILATSISQKVELLVKKIQDKKTQEIFINDTTMDVGELQDLMEFSDAQRPRKEEDSYTISIIATMKSIAHTIQTKARWDAYTKDHGMNDKIYNFSSKGDFTKVSHITDILTSPNVPRHIVMCTHLTRLTDLLAIAKYIKERNGELKKERVLRIYFDELDKYIHQMRHIINELVVFNCIQKIVIVTATPANIWNTQAEWKSIFVLNPMIENSEHYLMFKECKHYNIDTLTTEKSIEHDWLSIKTKEDKELINLHHTVVSVYPDILNPGKTIFAPGNVSRISHQLVAKFWNHMGGNVIIVNGERTMEGFYGQLILFDGQTIDIPHQLFGDLQSAKMKEYIDMHGFRYDQQAQLNDTIADLYHVHNLSSGPLFITGLLCVERAQSLMHPVWGTFTDAIFHKSPSPDNAYQLNRQLGHIKNWSTYRGLPRVFSQEVFRQDVLILEERANVFGIQKANTFASIEDYINAGSGKTSKEKLDTERGLRTDIRNRITLHPETFTTLDTVKEFLKKVLKRNVLIQPFHTIQGYQLTTRIKTYYGKDKDALVAEDRLTEEKFKRDDFNKKVNISSTDKGQKYMIFPVYPTMVSLPNEVKYYVSYLPTT